MKIKLTMSLPNATYKQRLNFLSKLYGTTEDFGILVTFNNALGFKPVSTYTSRPDGGYIIDPVVFTPPEYDTPHSFLCKAMEFFDEKDEVISFVVEDKNIRHPVYKYCYNTTDILFKWNNYIQKKFPKIEIHFSKMDDDYNQGLCPFVLTHFWKCLAYSEYCDTTISLSRKLTSVERRQILRVMSKIVDYTPTIYQEWCETCYSYHKDSPIHTELIKAT